MRSGALAVTHEAHLIILLFHLLFVFLYLKVSCKGAAVSGQYEVRVDASHLRFTFRPNRALNPIKPGPCSVQPADGQRHLSSGSCITLEESNV